MVRCLSLMVVVAFVRPGADELGTVQQFLAPRSYSLLLPYAHNISRSRNMLPLPAELIALVLQEIDDFAFTPPVHGQRKDGMSAPFQEQEEVWQKVTGDNLDRLETYTASLRLHEFFRGHKHGKVVGALSQQEWWVEESEQGLDSSVMRRVKMETRNFLGSEARGTHMRMMT